MIPWHLCDFRVSDDAAPLKHCLLFDAKQGEIYISASAMTRPH